MQVKVLRACVVVSKDLQDQFMKEINGHLNTEPTI